MSMESDELENRLIATLARIAEQLTTQTEVCGRMLAYLDSNELRNARAEKRHIEAHSIMKEHHALFKEDQKIRILQSMFEQPEPQKGAVSPSANKEPEHHE